MKRTRLIAVLLAICVCVSAETPPVPTSKDGASVAPFARGDRIAFLGDSITNGGQYHKYIFTYWATRHPEMGIRYVNKGVHSDFVRGGIGRLEFDVLKEKPNKIVINYGMNDSGASYREDLFGMEHPDATVLETRAKEVAKYRADMEKLLALLQERGITPILLGPSIYDETMKREGRNHLGANSGIQACIRELKDVCRQAGFDFVDFNEPMLEANAKLQAANPYGTIVGPDRVHPGVEGHWLMASVFLEAQHVTPFVARVRVDAGTGKVLEAANCEIRNVTKADRHVSFDYFPKSLPLPVNQEYQRAEQVVPITEKFNQERITVRGLAEGDYRLTMNGRPLGTFNAANLAQGVNVAPLPGNPGQQRAVAVDRMIQERARQEGRIRSLRQNDAGYAARFLAGEREKIVAEFRQRLDQTAPTEELAIKRLKQYLDDIAQEDAISRSNADLEAKIEMLCKPVASRVVLLPATEGTNAMSFTTKLPDLDRRITRHEEKLRTAAGQYDVVLPSGRE